MKTTATTGYHQVIDMGVYVPKEWLQKLVELSNTYHARITSPRPAGRAYALQALCDHIEEIKPLLN